MACRVICLALLSWLLMTTWPVFGQTTIDFDDGGNWTAGSGGITSYQTDHTYIDNDWTFTGGPALRQTTANQDGFPGALGTYSWRLQNAPCTWTATYNIAGTISAFSFEVRRWDGSPDPDWIVEYSTTGVGGTFTAVGTIDNTFLGNSSDWSTFSHTLGSPASVAADDFVVRVSRNGGERIMIDDFTFTLSVTAPTISLSTSTLSGFSYLVGNGPSANQTVTVSGSNLSPAADVLTVTGSTNYEVSTDGSTFSGSVTIPYTGGALAATTIYVRLIAGLSTGPYNGETITVSGGTATPETVTCNGNVFDVMPLFINEFSNGVSGSGTEEYIELVVDGGGCTTVDLRGIIIDDNNGLDDATCEGFGTTSTGSGVADGHYRFANIAQWSAVPSGSIIVLYVDSDRNPLLPPDDVDDTSPQDSVYIVPLRSAVLERMAGYPNAADPDCAYTTGTYENPPTSDLSMNFANGGDAAQLRYPDGSYLHGLSYGPSPMTGGPEGLQITTAGGGGSVFYFNDGDPRTVGNWTAGTALTSGGDETPGAPNNAANAVYMQGLSCGILLPLPQRWSVDCKGDWLILQVQGEEPTAQQWIETLTTSGSQERISLPYDHWVEGYRLPLQQQLQAWRWAEEDDNGIWSFGTWQPIPCQLDGWQVWQQGTQLASTDTERPITVYNLLGQPVAHGPAPLAIPAAPNGWYLVVQGHNRQRLLWKD